MVFSNSRSYKDFIVEVMFDCHTGGEGRCLSVWQEVGGLGNRVERLTCPRDGPTGSFLREFRFFVVQTLDSLLCRDIVPSVGVGGDRP